MRFVVDESSVQFKGVAPQDDLERFEQLLDRIDDVLDHKYKISYSADLFLNPVLNDQTLYDLYTVTAQLHIPRYVQERVAVIFGRLPKWDELEAALPLDFEVAVENSEPIWAPSIAWVHDQAIKNKDQRSACLVMPPNHFEGVKIVTCAGRTVPISFISTKSGYVQFFRWVIEKTTSSPDEIDEFSGPAFPNIIIIPDATSGIKKMSKSYLDLAPVLVKHLSAFSDECKAAFGSGSWQKVPAHFGSKGINISDENGNTKANRQAQQQRTKVVDGRALTFWWHSKLEPDRDRIHVYPDDIATGGKLIVGIFCRHLT